MVIRIVLEIKNTAMKINNPAITSPQTRINEAKKIEGVSEVQDGGANTERLFKLASSATVFTSLGVFVSTIYAS